jgi:two-component system, NtrC family, sensor histidine kinase AtoS
MARIDGPLTSGARSTRAKLLVVLPLVMMLLVGATGFFTLSMATRVHEDYRDHVVDAVTRAPGLRDGAQSTLTANDEATARTFARGRFAQLGVQVGAISIIAALLGFSIALGVSRPVRRMTEQLEALASGDLRGGLSIQSTSELDSLGGAVNDAISAIQRYYFQAMTGAVITLDAEGRVIGSSTAAEATLGYREEDLVGRRFSEVFTPATGSRATLMAVETAIARREPVAIDDVEILSADGRPVRIGISASYLQPASAKTTAGRPDAERREVIGVTIAFKDLNQMRNLRARLQQADQLVALGTVTAGVAHEIRNPLASLRGLAELLGRDLPEGDRRRRYVDTMLESIDRLNRLIEELLLFSAPKGVETTDVDIASVATETVSLARIGLGDRPIAILMMPDPPPPLVVRGSRERMVQVLTNLVLNATQATPEGGVVTVRVHASDGTALVDVHNTGSFIPADVRKQLFVPFFTTKPTGTGLGLAIARQIVVGMEGRIDVTSDAEAGTTFTIELPLTMKEEAAFA